MARRIAEALAAAALVMLLAGAAAYFLANFDSHPKDNRYMVQALEVQHG